MTDAPRKPRIAIMGEFSAGKSTLSNLLLGARPLPEKVTATRMSPVWISKGTEAPYRVDVDGSEEPVSLDDLGNIPVENTHVIRLFFEADILDMCDIIDFPGISDPNMDAEVWERVLPEVDAVLWCTHATQAWRQSESAVWDSFAEEVRANSMLLITRFDKLTTDRDRTRVVRRVSHETEGMFAGVFPMALLQALNAGDDYEAWEASGAAAFSEHLVHTIRTLSGADTAPATAEEPEYQPGPRVVKMTPNQADGDGAKRVLPRRVRAVAPKAPEVTLDEDDTQATVQQQAL